MSGVIRERMFSQFIKEDTRMSDHHFGTLDRVYKRSLRDIDREKRERGKTHRTHRARPVNRTIDVGGKTMERRNTGQGMNTIDTSRAMTSHQQKLELIKMKDSMQESRKMSLLNKLPNLRDDTERNFGLTTLSLVRTTSKEVKINQYIHKNKLELT